MYLFIFILGFEIGLIIGDNNNRAGGTSSGESKQSQGSQE